jgi:hypothetical protein
MPVVEQAQEPLLERSIAVVVEREALGDVLDDDSRRHQ